MVRASRDGDQFHYLWAARQCLKLLPGTTDLVAVTIEGASTAEAADDEVEAGDELIDVGLYYGSETRDEARFVRYIQLKHSTRRTREPFTASGLKKTIKGFAERYGKLLELFSADDVAQRFRFEFTTNRPIDARVKETLEDLASGSATRHPDLSRSVVDYTGLGGETAAQFFRLFVAEGGEDDLWAQRNLLHQNLRDYLPEADHDAPVQLKELVTRKATTEFESDPAIRQHDVLRALKTTEDRLQPARCLIPDASDTLPREQEPEILQTVLAAKGPIVIHADGGVGKSVLAARLYASMPSGSQAILYDCFGDGLYRNSLHFRHRHSDALVQIANELAALGLCHPLIPTAHADAKQYMRAFMGRVSQAVGLLRARNPEAVLCLIIDAADNAEMAAEEMREPASFVRDLIRTALPDGVCLALTCRTHRRERLGAPPEAQEVELRPFNISESARHLRGVYPSASDTEVAEFAFLSSYNPRVQALALSRGLPLQKMLKELGPEPTTVDRAIAELLSSAVARLRDAAGTAESSQIDVICQALAVLRPLVPISTLAQLSRTSESAVRSFALDLGRPLIVKGNSLHFLDEPAETWFRERFWPDAATLAEFIELLRPLTSHSSYAAAVLPQLLLQAGKLDELVELALSGEGLPTENPLERRDVELQRLTFALRACLQQGRHVDAAKLALKAGGESAGEQRQNKLIQDNTDIAAVLMAPDRIEDIVSRRTFGSGWMGSHHAYDAGLLSGREEFSAEAASRLRMANDWLRTWARLTDEKRQQETVSNADIAELTMAIFRIHGAESAASFLRDWRPRHVAFEGGRHLARRFIDLGRYDHLDELATAAGNDVWLLLGVAAEARTVGHLLPAAPLARALRLLRDRRVKLAESQEWNANWSVLCAIRSAVELALRVLPMEPGAWAEILRRYLPSTPPRDLTSRFGSNRVPLLRAYALEAALRGRKLTLIDVAPPDIRDEVEKSTPHGRSEEAQVFQREVGGLLPWFLLSAEITCGRPVSNLSEAVAGAMKETASAEAKNYRQDRSLRQTVALEWFRILRDAGASSGAQVEEFRSWMTRQEDPLWPASLISLCRSAARAPGFESIALECGVNAYDALEASREDAESQASSYLNLARAILTVSPAEAGVYFNRAVEIASRLGDENLYRWEALLHLAKAAGERETPRPLTAYRLSRAAELTYEYVARDKHFDWNGTVEAITSLCASSGLAILSRWRDRRFGDTGRLLPPLIYRLQDQGQLPAMTSVAFSGVEARWDRVADLRRAVVAESDPTRRSVTAQISFRYIRVLPWDDKRWSDLRELGVSHGVDFSGIDRLIAYARQDAPKEEKDTSETSRPSRDRVRRSPDWNAIFEGIDMADADALRAAYALVHTYDPPYELEGFFREAFARVRVGREPELVRALASWPDFRGIELRYLLDSLPSPMPKHMSLRRAVQEAVLAACRRQPEYVRRRSWGSLFPFEKLEKEELVPDRDIVRATIEGFTAQLDTLSAGELFHLVGVLAACVSPTESDEALNVGLDLLEDVLRPEDGDGPWDSGLKPPESVISSLAGYVWAGLGSPIVAERWQYAHVVRSVVELGWTELLEALVAWAEAGTAGPYRDRQLEFYIWHARQWLLIGLARGGRENPGALRAAAPLLLRLLDEEHVLIRELAAQTLRTLVAAGELTEVQTGDLDCVNRPSLPEEVYTGWQQPVDDDTSATESATEEVLSDDEKYYFGIDIGPYWFAPLGRAFGLTEHNIERRARHALRQRMGWSGGSGWQEDARHRRNIFDERETYHRGDLPPVDDLRAYHGYHAMMIVAATLLKQRPVRRRAGDVTDEFNEWLSDYLLTRSDGKWLADRRDPRLVTEPPPPASYDDKLWRWGVTAEYLDQKLVSDDGMVVFWGYWQGGIRDHEETVSVRSALVSRASAEALVAALQTAPELGRFDLPSAGEEQDLEAGTLRLTGWVKNEHVYARLDKGDPWAEGLHFPAPEPADDVVERLGLSASADRRAWTAGAGSFVRSETWTHIQGYGRERDTIPGWRLSGNEIFVEHLLNAYPENCLLLSVEIRRRPPRHGSDRDAFASYPQPYARYYLMEADGVAHAL